MSLVHLGALRFVISNATEADIVVDKTDCFDSLPDSHPGKLTKFLYERFLAFDSAKNKGLIILPVELIVNNGCKLCECLWTISTPDIRRKMRLSVSIYPWPAR
jgi:tagaturonate reductase